MTHGLSGGRIVIRLAAEGDSDAVARFQCSTGAWYEEDVESFVRLRALAQALAMPEHYRLLLAFDGDRLVCCMAHHLEMLISQGGKSTIAARLQLFAIAVEDQGCRLADGTRLSDLVMATFMSDAMETRATGVITAIVALDNLRSIALCKRHGMRSQVRYDARHARLSGHFTPR